MKNITYAKSQTETYTDVDDNGNPTVYSYNLMIEVNEDEGFNRENIKALQLILDKATENYINFKVS
jgi:hypothetical protein